MKSILLNPWVIGIVTGLIVTIVSRFVFKGFDKKEYILKVGMANKELINAIKPTIPENNIPGIDIIEALAFAYARQQQVTRSDMYSLKQISDQLVKEVMDSSFISIDCKSSYCKEISQSLKKEDTILSSQESPFERTVIINHYKSRMLTLFTAMLGVMAAMASLLSFNFDHSNTITYSHMAFRNSSIIILLSITLMIITSVTLLRYRELAPKHKVERDTNEKE